MLSHGDITLDSDMSDRKSTLPQDSGQPPVAGAPVSLSRRRFARGAAPVLLGTLASKPVLGAEYICTLSGHTSGNASAHLTEGVNCAVGFGESHWLNSATTWPSDFTKGGVNPQCSPTGNATLFNGFPTAGTPKLDPKFFVQKVSDVCTLGTSGTAASMLQVLSSTGSDPLSRLGRATVVSLLNVNSPAITYPVTQARIIEMFNAVKDGANYKVEGANLELTQLGVIEYLEKLYT
jgi:hypothetical protein